MDNLQCKNCQHFIQHYAYNNEKFFQVYCGHCTQKTAKRRQPDTKACESFVPRSPKEIPFATKEYITKALVDRICSLEILPKTEIDPTLIRK